MRTSHPTHHACACPCAPPSDSSRTCTARARARAQESAEEAYRRRQWILYYVSVGQFAEAEDIGWDGRHPPDPRMTPESLDSHGKAPSADTAAAAVGVHVVESVASWPANSSQPGAERGEVVGHSNPPPPAAALPAERKPRKPKFFGRGRKGKEGAGAPAAAAPPLSPRVVSLSWLQQRMAQV